jgi:hypothetical protein
MSQDLKEVTIKSKQRLNSKGLNRYEIHITDKMLEEIEAIALSDGAKVHHISKKPIIRDTVISLLELGIKAIYDGVELPKKSNENNTDNDNRIDLTVLNDRIEDKLKPLYSLISELSDKVNRIANTDNNGYTDNDNRIDLTDKVTGYVDAVSCAIVDNIISPIQDDITAESTLSESPTLPLNKVSPHNIPNEELKVNNDNVFSKPSKTDKLSLKQEEILEKMEKIEKGETFKSQADLASFLELEKGEKPHISKLKPLWENKLFSIQFVNGSNQLTKL